jgi:hypothetical protein
VSYFFSHYFEAGRDSLDFFGSKLEPFGLDGDGRLRRHRVFLQQLRTYLQHNLSPSKGRDLLIRQECERWFRDTCGADRPSTEAEWQACLQQVLADGIAYVSVVAELLSHVCGDESKDEIVSQWTAFVSRSHRPEDFDRVIAVVAGDLGREHLDVVRFRNRFYDKWIQELGAQTRNYDFEREARKLVEHALLSSTTPVLPITGADIIERFAIEPGPKIGELLRAARQLYDAAPCNKDDLLARLAEAVA